VVGFTKLSGYVDPAELEHVLSGFEDLVSAAVSRTDDTLLAKFIGDAAMIVAADPVPLTTVLVEIVENRQRLAEAPRRGGIAFGKVLVREGDYYGPVPNMAARLTDHANPWSLLADDGARGAAGGLVRPRAAVEGEAARHRRPQAAAGSTARRRRLTRRRPTGSG
jgi:adenylate cyclase